MAAFRLAWSVMVGITALGLLPLLLLRRWGHATAVRGDRVNGATPTPMSRMAATTSSVPRRD
jgi:hypothetical protein